MNLLFGFGIMVLCLLLQATLAGVSLRYFDRNERYVVSGSLFAAMTVLIGVMGLLLLGNLLQIAFWAFLFRAVGEFDTFVDAYYHSAVNFATLGYGDIVMSEAHRILGALEAINGVLMIGVSTAVLMTVLLDSRKMRSAGRRD